MTYLKNVTTLKFDPEKCTGCTLCTQVCPHGVFAMKDKRAEVLDRDLCMECGACAKNCAAGAISVRAGVGCAAAIIWSNLRGSSEISCGEDCGPGNSAGDSDNKNSSCSSGGGCCG